MGGTNPYIEKADVALPQKSYIVTFIFPDKTEKKVEVQPDKIPYGPTGLPGSILDIAMEFDQSDEAPVTTLQSRLGCQCVPNGTVEVVVEIPAINKNLAKEGH